MTRSSRPTPAALGFRKVARFCRRAEHPAPGRRKLMGEAGERIEYVVNEDAAATALWAGTQPVTYMWIVAGEELPVYVGKASFGMARRAPQHVGGFRGTAAQRAVQEQLVAANDPRNASAGLGHARRIRALWEEGKQLELWVRPAGTIELFGRTGSLVSVEEEILISLFQPGWNDETYPEDEVLAEAA